MKYKITFLMYQVITGGIENILLNLIKELSDIGDYDISVLSSNVVTEKKFIDFFKQNNVKLVDVKTYMGAPRPKNFFKRKLQYIKRYINNKKISKCVLDADLLIDYFNGAFFGFIKDVPVKKIMFPHCSVKVFLSDHGEKNTKEMLNTYDKIICISKNFFDVMISKFPDYKDKFVCIYNPIDYEDIRKKSEQITNTKNDLYFTSVARLSEEKDHETLLRAFALFLKKEHYPDVKLYILGSGPLLEKWQKLSQLLKIEKNVVFLGNVLNPYKYVKNAIANILSSFGEGLPTVLIEAQVLNTLNIASNVESGISEILLDGKAGMLFESKNSVDLAQKMSDVYNDKVNKKLMIKTAYNNLKRFDIKERCHDIDVEFKKVLEK